MRDVAEGQGTTPVLGRGVQKEFCRLADALPRASRASEGTLCVWAVFERGFQAPLFVPRQRLTLYQLQLEIASRYKCRRRWYINRRHQRFICTSAKCRAAVDIVPASTAIRYRYPVAETTQARAWCYKSRIDNLYRKLATPPKTKDPVDVESSSWFKDCVDVEWIPRIPPKIDMIYIPKIPQSAKIPGYPAKHNASWLTDQSVCAVETFGETHLQGGMCSSCATIRAR